MPIGTKSTLIRLKVKQTPRTRISIETKKNDFWAKFFEFLGIQILIGLASAGAGWIAGASLLAVNSTELILTAGKVIASSVVDFALSQGYDALNNDVTTTGTLLNVLPAVSGIGKITRANRITKSLRLADKLGTFEKMGIKAPRNMESFIAKVSGKKITYDELKIIFDYTNKISKATLFNNMSYLIRKDITNKKAYGKWAESQISDWLDYEKTVRKLHPTLAIKNRIPSKKEFEPLYKMGLQVEDVVKMSKEDWYKTAFQLQQQKVSRNVLLNINYLREEANKYIISKTANKLAKVSGKIVRWSDPVFWAKEAIDLLSRPIKKMIKKIETKVSKNLVKLAEKGKKIFTKLEEKIYNSGLIMPFAFGSNVFLGYSVKPVGIGGDVFLTIYYRDIAYPPITIVTTALKVKEFVLAKSPFRYYLYKSGWALGWGFKKNMFITLTSFAPGEMQQLINSSMKTYHSVLKSIRNITKIKRIINNQEDKNKWWEKEIIPGAIKGAIGGTFLYSGYKLAKKGKPINISRKFAKITKSKVNSKIKKHKNKNLKGW